MKKAENIYKDLKRNESKTFKKLSTENEISNLKNDIKLLEKKIDYLLKKTKSNENNISNSHENINAMSDELIKIAKHIFTIKDDVYLSDKAKNSINKIYEDQDLFNRFMNEKFYHLNVKLQETDDKVNSIMRQAKKSTFNFEEFWIEFEKRFLKNLRNFPEKHKLFFCDLCNKYTKEFKENFLTIGDTISVLSDNSKLLCDQFVEMREQLDDVLNLDIIKKNSKNYSEEDEEYKENAKVFVIRQTYMVFYVQKAISDKLYEFAIKQMNDLETVKVIYVCFLIEDEKVNEQQRKNFEEKFLGKLIDKDVEIVCNDYYL